MGEVIRFEERKRRGSDGARVVKWIDGKPVEFVDFEMLSITQQHRLLDANSERIAE